MTTVQMLLLAVPVAFVILKVAALSLGVVWFVRGKFGSPSAFSNRTRRV